MSKLGCLSLFATLLLSCGSTPSLTWDVSQEDGSYAITVDGAAWFSSALNVTLCVGGKDEPLAFISAVPVSGTDVLGAWTGSMTTLSSSPSGVHVTNTFKSYASSPSTLIATAAFPDGVDVAGPVGCGGVNNVRTQFPAFDTSAVLTPSLGYFTWSSEALSHLPATLGLAALGQNSLDAGPVVAFELPVPGVPNPTLIWSTFDSHKVVTQATFSSPQPPLTAARLSSLWSASRADQVACLSPLCASDQVLNGDYVTQRVEGWGVVLATAPPGTVTTTICLNGANRNLSALSFAWSSKAVDNVIINSATGGGVPSADYSIMGQNGWILSDATTPGSLPLYNYRRDYNSSHIDWAAVASPEGITWANENNYTVERLLGYVFVDEPVDCSLDAASSVYAMGLSAAVPSIPAGWNYSVIFSAAYGGPTAATYVYGDLIKTLKKTTRSPSVTLSDIGYYTDDGAFFYVWEAFNIPARPQPAESLLLAVKEDLYARGIPVAYMQLDDWWYSGAFYFGNVKSVTDWHASNASRLFPHGLPLFSSNLNLSLQLYTPFFADNFVTPYNMTESTAFKGTKIVTPKDSYNFFSDLFDLGTSQTGNRFVAYEVDFLLSNFAGSASMFETVYSASQWYAGLADAAAAHNLVVQFCLCSASDILESLTLPAVVQARASADYVNKVANPFALGGSSLLMGALSIAPSKDTLWTASPQPGTMSDTEHNGLSYTTQPHVALDCVLATLSLGPVGISDGLGQVDAALISQAFRSANDSTLLRPSRPLSWVDTRLVNVSHGDAATAADVRSTHTAVPKSAQGGMGWLNSHLVLAWQTDVDVTLGATDLYPAPKATASLVARAHVLEAGPSQQAGCIDGSPAVPSCVIALPAGSFLTVPSTGGATNLSAFAFWAVAEPLENGAFFLGELAKFVHVAPQRFDYVGVGGTAAAGLRIGVRGSSGEAVLLTAIDSGGIVRIVTANIPVLGFIEIDI